MIIKANLIETGEYMHIRGKKLYVETHGNPKISQFYTCMVDQGKLLGFFISSSGTFKRFFICNYDRSKRCLSLRKITEDRAFGLNDLIEDCEELKSITN